jgi:hypothetical protein
VDGSHFVQELSCHQTGRENLAFVVASRRFQVECEEGREEVVGQEGQQQETFDGIGVMAKQVIGMPLMGELSQDCVLFSQQPDGNSITHFYQQTKLDPKAHLGGI